MFLIIVSIILFIYAAIVFATGKNIFGNNNKYIKEEFYALYNKCSAVDLMLYIVLIDIWYFTNCSYWILIFSVVAVTLVIYIVEKRVYFGKFSPVPKINSQKNNSSLLVTSE